jgi:hypothetical protein
MGATLIQQRRVHEEGGRAHDFAGTR